MQHLIVGIDPGSTIGIAAITLEGKPCKTAHVEAGGIGAAVSIIESWGTPSLIATDVRPAPEMAIRLASSFNVPLFVPQRPWREEDKRRLLKEIDKRQARDTDAGRGERKDWVVAQNAHERDALSAAVQAWRANQNLLREALSSDVPEEKKEALCHLLLQGYRHEFAMQKINEKERLAAKSDELEAGSQEEDENRLQKSPEDSRAGRQRQIEASGALNAQLASLERANVELRKRVSFLEHERDGFEQRIRLYENGVRERMLREGEYRKMASQLEFLSRRLMEANARIAKQKRHGNRFMDSQNPQPAFANSQKSQYNSQNHSQASGQNQPNDRERGSQLRAQKSQGIGQNQERRINAPNATPDADDESLKGLDSIRSLESLIRQYQRSRLEEKDKD